MSSETQAVGLFDQVKWVASIVVLGAATYANSYFGDQYPALYRFIALIALLAMVLFVLSTTKHGQSFIQLAKDSRLEMRKVVWPSKNETLVTSGFVVLVVFIFSIALWAVDWILRSIVSAILG